MKRSRAHILASDGSIYPFGCFCRHCGAFQQLATPIELPVYLVALRAFEASHAACQPQAGAAERLAREVRAARG